jgi:hypothetical protein
MNSKILVLFLIAASTLFRCASATPGFGYTQFGYIYTDVRDTKAQNIPVGEVPWSPDLRIGNATCKQFSIFVALGDCSIEKAMKNGNIKKLHHVDYEVHNIMTFYIESITKAYGQ